MRRQPIPAPRPTPLSRREIVDAALALLDEVGLEGLTTRRLASRLGVQVGALYWHVASKRDLLAAMAERMVEEFCEAPLPEGEWEDRLRSEAQRLRQLLESHRDGARLLVSVIGDEPGILGVGERFLRILREAGFSLEIAGYGWDTIASYVTGFVLQEQSAARGSDAFPDALALRVQAVDVARFPHLAEWVAQRPHPPDHGFLAKLNLIIDGLRLRRQ